MSKWLKWILSYLLIGIVDGDPEPDAAPEDAGETQHDQDADVDADTADEDTEEEAEPVQAKEPSRAQRAIIEARRRAQDAEVKAADAARELDRVRQQQTAGPSQADRQFQEEEAKLRDPATNPMERWQIESNRTIRQSAQQAAMARAQAEDIGDRTAYQSRSMDNPRMRTYADRVEKRLEEMRKAGQNAPREAIYLFLLGKDVNEGTVKPASSKPKPKPGALPVEQRGKPAAARSDVSARQKKSESEARRNRLSDQII